MTASSYPVNLSPPDITAYRKGNTGVDYITTFDSGKPGPHVMVSAIVHGNELCGAITLDFLFQQNIRPQYGKLTLGFMNVAAFHNFEPANPDAARFVDEDFNRLWSSETLMSNRDSVELRRAREVRPVIDQIDYLLDIHSMQHPTVPLMMCGITEKGRRLARTISFPAHIICDAGHAAGKRMRDYAGFGEPASPKNALLVECGQHWEKRSAIVAKEVTLRFLAHFGVLEPAFLAAHITPEPPSPAQTIEVTQAVTIRHETFTFAQHFTGMEVIPAAGTIIGWDGDEPVLTPYDNCVLIMPSRRLYKNQTAVRLGRYTS